MEHRYRQCIRCIKQTEQERSALLHQDVIGHPPHSGDPERCLHPIVPAQESKAIDLADEQGVVCPRALRSGSRDGLCPQA